MRNKRAFSRLERAPALEFNARGAAGTLAAISCLLVALTFAAYAPVAGAKFIWDDDDYILNNKNLGSLAGLADIWLDPSATPQYYPMVHTTFWVEHALWGLDPRGFHLVNVAIHAACAVLLLRLLLALRIPGAMTAAFLFAIHPVMVESVAWVTERKNVLSLLFYIISAHQLCQFFGLLPGRMAGGARHYALGFGGLICALLAKSVTCSLPAVVLLLIWWRRGVVSRREGWALLPLFAAGIFAASVTVWLEKHHVGARGEPYDLSVGDRIMIASRAPWFYLGKLLWPGALSFVYPRWSVGAWDWRGLVFVSATPLLLAGLVLASRRWSRGPLVGILAFGGTLVPALGFFDVFPFQYSFVADHFQYHASLAVIVMIAWIFEPVIRRDFVRFRIPPAGGFVGGALLLHTVLQCLIYVDQERLWTDTLRKNPGALIAHNNLGAYYASKGRLAEAARCYEAGHNLDPDDPHLRVNLASAYVEIGRVDDAFALTSALVVSGDPNPWLWEMMGRGFLRQGRADEALDAFQRAVRAKSDMAEAWSGMATALVRMGRSDGAREILRQGLGLIPDDPLLMENLRRLEGGR